MKKMKKMTICLSAPLMFLMLIFFFPQPAPGQEKRAINPIPTLARLKGKGDSVKNPVPPGGETVKANVERAWRLE